MPKVRIGHNVSNAKINSDGTFTDDYTRTFEDMVVTPRRTELKRGSYSANNWNYAKAHRKDWMKTHWPSAVVDDKPLEEVYPEFDILMMGAGLRSNPLTLQLWRNRTLSKEMNKVFDEGLTGATKDMPVVSASDMYNPKHFRSTVKYNPKQIGAQLDIENISSVQQHRQKLLPVHNRDYATIDIPDEYAGLSDSGSDISVNIMPRINTGEPVILPGRVPIKSIKIPTITKTNAAKVTALEWDAAYNASVKSGNMQEAQRLRDLHFYTKSSKSKASRSLYKHSTYEEPFNSFDLDHKSNYTVSRRNGRGVYLEDEGDLSQMSEIQKRMARGSYGSYGDNTMNLRVNFKSPENIHNYSDVPMSNHPEGYISDYESFIRDPKMIKSDNAITYDDAGNIIPLSKRDNFSINDIRYLLPFAIGGGIGYGLYNSSQQ